MRVVRITSSDCAGLLQNAHLPPHLSFPLCRYRICLPVDFEEHPGPQGTSHTVHRSSRVRRHLLVLEVFGEEEESRSRSRPRTPQRRVFWGHARSGDVLAGSVSVHAMGRAGWSRKAVTPAISLSTGMMGVVQEQSVGLVIAERMSPSSNPSATYSVATRLRVCPFSRL